MRRPRLALRGARLAILASTMLSASPAPAQVPVELELLLAVDASGSVSPAEFDLQVQGLARAFRDPEVIAAIRDAGPGGIAVALMQWSSPGQQIVAVDWSVLTGEASAEAFADRIVAVGRLILGETAIDGALRFAMQELAGNGFVAPRRMIDISGDGEANWGASPDGARDRAVAAGITINGLAVTNEQPGLAGYYRDHVIGGSGAFVLAAADYAAFAAAIRMKLIREVGRGPISQDGTSAYPAPPG